MQLAGELKMYSERLFPVASRWSTVPLTLISPAATLTSRAEGISLYSKENIYGYTIHIPLHSPVKESNLKLLLYLTTIGIIIFGLSFAIYLGNSVPVGRSFPFLSALPPHPSLPLLLHVSIQ